MGDGLAGILKGEFPDSNSRAAVVEVPKVSGEVTHSKDLWDRWNDSRARKSLERKIRRYGNGYRINGDFIYSGETPIGYINFEFWAPRVELVDQNLHWKFGLLIPRDMFFVEYRKELSKMPPQTDS